MLKKLFLFISLFIIFSFIHCSENNSPTESTPNYSSAVLQKGGNSALSFDGVDDYVLVPDNLSLDMTDGFTITAWIYLNDYTEWASVVTKGGFFGDPNFGENNYTIHQSGPGWNGGESGHLRFTGVAYFPNGLPESNTKIPLHEWHYIAVTFDGSMVKFYLDGKSDGEGVVVGPLNPNDQPLNIGVDFPGGDEYQNGMIDEVKIWNAPLKETHIFAAMHGSATPYATSLVGYWRFNEGEGTIASDKSLFRNDGQLMNGPTWVTR